MIATMLPSRLRRLGLALTVGAVAAGGTAGPAHAVIGGTPTADGLGTFAVALVDASSRKTVAAGQFCGASLIAPNLLITAAHCVADSDGYQSEPSDIKVFTGKVLPLRKGPLLSVKSIRVFPHFEDGAGETNGDVATIQLSAPITDRQPIGMLQAGDGSAIEPGAELHLWGWGNRATGEFENYPRQLQDGPVMRYSDATCDDYYGRFFNPAGQLCAGWDDGHVDACQGDSGGPLTATRPDGVPVLLGIVSYGEGCGVAKFPTVYTKIGRYRRFVKQSLTIAAQPEKPKTPKKPHRRHRAY